MTGDFICAICQRESRPTLCTRRGDCDFAPICYMCEVEYTTISNFPRGRSVGRPRGGTHMDRRQAMRLFAIAEAIHSEALKIKWRRTYASS